MKTALSIQEAYLAMFAFLEDYYERTGADDIGSLLSGLSLMNDGNSIDPAFWSDWKAAVNKAAAGNVDASVRFQKSVSNKRQK